jgi:RHH-type proline utilization regulon transcriptional repressor/proline dehydrogenase/delta 1-pyrroline-5-carboxylate dehydrogenase
VLYLEPRGVLACFADKDVTFEYWILSIVTALATGNVVISVVSELFYAEAIEFREQFVATGAPSGVFQVAKLHHLEPLLAEEKLAGVVIDSESDRSSYMVQMLAKRTGAILPVITAEYYDHLIQRLLTEKTVSIDTTASGGNTSLMTLVEEDE